MPRYFFDLHGGPELFDDEGALLVNAEEIRIYMVAMTTNVASDKMFEMAPIFDKGQDHTAQIIFYWRFIVLTSQLIVEMIPPTSSSAAIPKCGQSATPSTMLA